MKTPPNRQQGAAMLALLVLVVAGTLFLFVGQISSAAIQIRRDQVTADALVQAKAALIAYAASYDKTHANDVPGYLPCPEVWNAANTSDQEGKSAVKCPASGSSKNVTVIGRFPWKTLGLPPLRDGWEECLWLVVSGTFKYNPATDMMNWDTPGQLSVRDANGLAYVVGLGPEELAAAAIIAPGRPMGSQDRTPVANAPVCGGNYTPSAYLEIYKDGAGNIIADNTIGSPAANGTSVLMIGNDANGGNDRIAIVTAKEIFDAVRARSDFQQANTNNPLVQLTQDVALCIAGYGQHNAAGSDDKRLPWAAAVDLRNLLNPTDVTPFLDRLSYDDASGTSNGRVPYVVSTSRTATANQLTSQSSGKYVLFETGAQNACPTWSTWDRNWYDNWKEHLYYAVGNNFSPAGDSESCGHGGGNGEGPGSTSGCLSVGSSGSTAAVVLFANTRITTTQHRYSAAQKADAHNYLEGANASSISGSGTTFLIGSASASFNDILYCIDDSLGVAPCH